MELALPERLCGSCQDDHRGSLVYCQENTMRSSKAKAVAGLTVTIASALLVGASIAPASAATPSSGLTFFSGSFAGTTVTYATPSTSCTALPLTANADLNLTNSNIVVYKSANCSGASLSFPAGDIHSFSGYNGLSYRATN
jgi:hypothetical protein